MTVPARAPETPAPPAGEPAGTDRAETGDDHSLDQVRQLVANLHAFVDLVDVVRSRRIRGLGVLVALNLADLVTTAWFLARGGREGNPVLASVIHRWWLVLIIKALVIAVVGRRVLAASPRSREARWLVNLAIVYCVTVVVWNLGIIVRL